MQELIDLALAHGFSHAGAINTAALRPLQAVRDMCADGRCQRYGKCWSCPPGCGTLEETSARMARYERGLLLQTTGELEDDFDVETMTETGEKHKELFAAFAQKLRQRFPDCLPLTAGTCTLCKTCTYPDAPCRFPDKMLSSMEAYGLLVSDVCTASGLGYYYGPRTITYTACILFP